MRIWMKSAYKMPQKNNFIGIKTLKGSERLLDTLKNIFLMKIYDFKGYLGARFFH